MWITARPSEAASQTAQSQISNDNHWSGCNRLSYRFGSITDGHSSNQRR